MRRIAIEYVGPASPARVDRRAQRRHSRPGSACRSLAAGWQVRRNIRRKSRRKSRRQATHRCAGQPARRRQGSRPCRSRNESAQQYQRLLSRRCTFLFSARCKQEPKYSAQESLTSTRSHRSWRFKTETQACDGARSSPARRSCSPASAVVSLGRLLARPPEGVYAGLRSHWWLRGPVLIRGLSVVARPTRGL